MEHFTLICFGHVVIVVVSAAAGYLICTFNKERKERRLLERRKACSLEHFYERRIGDRRVSG